MDGASELPGVVAVSLLALAVTWKLVRTDGPPVLGLALAFQWAQVAGAPAYVALTGRTMPDVARGGWIEMVLIALVAILVLALGLRLGMRRHETEAPSGSPIGWRMLIVIYALFTAGERLLMPIIWQLGSLHQIVTCLLLLRFALLFLMLRRLLAPPRYGWFALLVGVELALGFTGFFADFREVLMLAALALLEQFDRRRLSHWAGLGAMAVLALGLGVVWTGIKDRYRASQMHGGSAGLIDRVVQVEELATDWAPHDSERLGRDFDKLMGRLWAIPIQARALQVVPASVPHQDGALFLDSLLHVVTPRVFFPDKPSLADADTNMGRHFAAAPYTPLQATSVAFGYVAESYVDFGVPLMFLPILAFGLFMGAAYRLLNRMIRDPELAAALSVGIFWTSLFSYERSWTKMLGTSVAILIVGGAVGIGIDRLIARLRRRSAVAIGA
jgi:hypothetical protein